MKWRGKKHIWGKGGVHTGFWRGNLRLRDHLDDAGANGGDSIKMDLQEMRWEAQTGLIWLKIRTVGGILHKL
jgi:hypothetical protein